MLFLKKLAAAAFVFSSINAFGAIDAEQIKQDILVMSGEIAQPVIYNNSNRSVRDKNDPEYTYRDGPMAEMSQYQYQDDLLFKMFKATQDKADKKAFEAEILKNLESVKDPYTKCELIRMLEFVGSEKSFAFLKKTILSDDENAALAACDALQKMDAKNASSVLVECFKAAKNPKIKQMAVYAAAIRADNSKFVKKMEKSAEFSQAALDGSLKVIPTQLDKFQSDFTNAPSKQKALDALKSDNEWQCAFVVPYIFQSENSLIGELQNRYDSASANLKAWIISNAKKVLNDPAKKFIFDNAKNAKDEYVCLACALALEKIGGKDSAIAMLDLRAKVRGGVQNEIDWAFERMNVGNAEVDAYIINLAKENDKNALRLIGSRGINAKPLLLEKLSSPVWYEAMLAFENLANESDMQNIIKIIKQEKSADASFINRFGFVVRNVAIRTLEPAKVLDILTEAVNSAPDSAKQGLRKCYFLALMECGNLQNLTSLAEKAAADKADKMELAQLPQLAKRLSRDNWKRMPEHKKYEAQFVKIAENAKCSDGAKAALEKSLTYIKNKGEEPKK